MYVPASMSIVLLSSSFNVMEERKEEEEEEEEEEIQRYRNCKRRLYKLSVALRADGRL